MRRSVMALGASMTLAALACALAFAQDRKEDKKKDEAKPAAPPPAAPPQEKVQFQGSLDSWYKVLEGDGLIGHVNESLKPGVQPVRYEYTVLVEYETQVEDPQDPGRMVPFLDQVKISAKLDDSFAPIDMTYSRPQGNAELVGKVLQTDTGRRLEVKLGEGVAKSFPVPSGVDLFYTPHLMLIFMRQNDQLSRTGLHNAKVFYPRIEEAPVVDVSFDVKGWVQREYLGKKVSVTRIDWIKPMPAVSKEFEIVETYVDKLGRVVEEVTRDSKLKFLIAKGEEEAVGQSTRIRMQGRNDPFRKDLAMGMKEEKGRPRDKVDGGKDPRTLDDGLAQAEKLVEALKKAKDRKDLKEAQDVYNKGIKLYIQMRVFAEKEQNPEALGKLHDFKRKLEDLFGGAKQRLEEARRRYVDALGQFDREDVAGMEKTVVELRTMENLPEFVGSEDELRQLKTWNSDLGPLLARCRTRLELARKKLVLTGVTLCFDEKPQMMEPPLVVFGHGAGAPHELRFIRATHFAIINDKMYKVGDMVEGEGVKVEVIRKYSVQVSLQEETREVGIRQ